QQVPAGGERAVGVIGYPLAQQAEQGPPDAALRRAQVGDGRGVAVPGGQRVEVGLRHRVRGPASGGLVRPDVRDDLLQVGAVDGRVRESAAGPVAVSVQAAAAAGDDGTLAAGGGQAGDALLPRLDGRVGGGRVKRVPEDVEAGRGRAVVGDLDRVGLLDRAVGLDDRHVARCEAERLGAGDAAVRGLDDRLEHADGHAAAVARPLTEHRRQPVRVAGRSRFAGPGRRAVPGAVREQEVQVRRLERGEGAVYGDGVAADVDGREQPGVDLPVALAAQQGDGAQHLVVAAAPVGVPAVQVVGRPVAVERDPYLDALGAEQLAQFGVEPDTVRVDAQVKTADGFDRAAQP